MPTLIKHESPAENPWLIIDKAADVQSLASLEEKHLILPFELWLNHRAELAAAGFNLAVWLDSDETPHCLQKHFQELTMIALNFPSFVDGRAYTSATCLRQQLGYPGEIRAIGEVLQDQLFYMQACGFDAFDLHESVEVDAAIKALSDFSNSYMSTVKEPAPLFRRRR